MNIFKAIGGFFKRAAVGIYGVLKSFVTSDAVKSLLKTALGSITEQVVSELQYENLSSSQKRQAAIERVMAKAIEEGLEAKENVVRLLIEVVVAKLKSS